MIKKLIGGYVPPYKDKNGNVVTNSVSKLEKIKLGGVEQWYTVRGKSKELPILLFLHGGPGSPQTGAQMKYNAALEEHYLVVNWDQRGSGKSYSPSIAPESMNINQMLSDARELVEHVLKTYNKKKVFLMGHSVGAAYGLLFTHRYPELVQAYVGINQPVDRTDEENRSYEFTLETARNKNNKKAIKQLEAVGYPINGVYKSTNDLVAQRTWLTKFNGVTYKMNAAFVNIHYIFSSHLRFKEKLTFMKGFGFTNTHMWNEVTALNFFSLVQEVKVPVYFVVGKHDKIVFMDKVQQYVEFLKAPKKQLIVFEQSGHYAPFEENDKFNVFMIEQVLRENGSTDSLKEWRDQLAT